MEHSPFEKLKHTEEYQAVARHIHRYLNTPIEEMLVANPTLFESIEDVRSSLFSYIRSLEEDSNASSDDSLAEATQNLKKTQVLSQLVSQYGKDLGLMQVYSPNNSDGDLPVYAVRETRQDIRDSKALSKLITLELKADDDILIITRSGWGGIGKLTEQGGRELSSEHPNLFPSVESARRLFHLILLEEYTSDEHIVTRQYQAFAELIRRYKNKT